MDDKRRALIASRIKSERLAKGISTKDAGIRSGVGQRRWVSYENNERTPKIDILESIADAIGSSAAYIAGYIDHKGEVEQSWRYIIADKTTDKLITNNSDSLAFNVDTLKDRRITENTICCFDALDNSLAPLISSGDQVLIDSSHITVDSLSVYAVKSANNTAVFRWIRPELTGGYTVFANDSSGYPDSKMSNDEFSQIQVLGRYIGLFHWVKD